MHKDGKFVWSDGMTETEIDSAAGSVVRGSHAGVPRGVFEEN